MSLREIFYRLNEPGTDRVVFLLVFGFVLVVAECKFVKYLTRKKRLS